MNNQINPLVTLKKALASYDETINIFNHLPLEKDDNRRTLACAYINRGDVLKALGKKKKEALEDALASYDKAINLAKTLPLEISQNSKTLAEAYMKRGNVLFISGTQALDSLEELSDRRQRYTELASLLQTQLEEGDAEYDERVGSLLEQELKKPLFSRK
jgi:tetratricopeptide (TPR) repeat protein